MILSFFAIYKYFSTKKESKFYYNTIGDIMKKNLTLVFICLGLGIYMGYIMFNGYKKEDIKQVSIISKINKLYFIQIGIYSNLNQMKQELSGVENYIYTKEKGIYHVYTGITKNKKNKKKLEEYFNKLGYDTYVKEFDIENQKFDEVLTQYDSLLKETNDDKAIATICNQILNQYKELVVNVESKGNTKK